MESPEQRARSGVVLGTNLVVCLTWLETLFEHAPMGPKNARFGVVSHEIWLSKVGACSGTLRDSGVLPFGTQCVVLHGRRHVAYGWKAKDEGFLEC